MEERIPSRHVVYDNKRRWSNNDGNNNRGGRFGRGGRGQPYSRGGFGRGGFHNDDDGNKRVRTGELETQRTRGPRIPANMVERKTLNVLSPEVEMAKQLITRVSDFTTMQDLSEIPTNLYALADAFINKGDLITFAEDISDLFIKCFSQLSLQIPIISTLLSLIHKSESNFTQLVLTRLTESLLQATKDDNISVIKLNLRTMACLAASGSLELDGENSILSILKILLKLINGSNSDSFDINLFQNSSASQAAAYLMASIIPWLINSLMTVKDTSNEVQVALDSILDIFTQIRGEWSSPFDVKGKYSVFHSNIANTVDGVQLPHNGPPGCACWDDLWSACDAAIDVIEKNMQGGYEPPPCLQMPWLLVPTPDDEDNGTATTTATADPASNEADTMEGTGEGDAITESVAKPTVPPAAQKLQLSPEFLQIFESTCQSTLGMSVNLDQAQAVETLEPLNNHYLTLRFPVFDSDSAPAAESLLSLPALDRHLLADSYGDILTFFEPYIRDDGTRIGSLELLCKHLLAVKLLYPPEIKLEFCLVEVLLLRLLQHPAKRPSLVFRVLLELCRKLPEFPPVLATGTTCLYQLTPILDTASVRQLSKWHISHLLNSQLSWPYWSYLGSDYEEAEEGDPRRVYLHVLMDGLARASVAQKIKDASPATLHACVPVESLPKCPFFEEEAPSEEVDPETQPQRLSIKLTASKLKLRVEAREAPEDIQDWLEQVHEGVEEEIQTTAWRLQMLLQCILMLGLRFKALTPLASLLDRYGALLRDLAADDGGGIQKTILDCCVTALSHDYGTLHQVLDLLLRRAIIKPSVVLDWTSSPESLAAVSANIFVWPLVELPVLRALDGCRAALAKCVDELGADVVIESRVIKDMSGAITHIMGGGGGAKAAPAVTPATEAAAAAAGEEPMQVIGAPVDAAEEGGEGDMEVVGEDSRRARDRSTGEGQGESLQATDNEMEEDAEDVTAMVTAVVEECRSVYRMAMSRLLLFLAARGREILSDVSKTSDDVDLDPLVVTSLSLLRRLLRAFHSTQTVIDKKFPNLAVSVLAYDYISSEYSFADLPVGVTACWTSFAISNV